MLGRVVDGDDNEVVESDEEFNGQTNVNATQSDGDVLVGGAGSGWRGGIR